MNKKTRALTTEEYKLIISTIRQGYTSIEGRRVKGNNRLATLLVIQSNLGLRISDILKLRLSDIVRDGERYRLNIVEQKTSKERTFTVPNEIYNYIKIYTLENNIKSNATIFPISERAIQKQLKIVSEYLNLDNISTHSFRKYFATQIYINNNYNIALVKELLQHSSVAITQKYIGISSKEIEEALNKHIQLL